MPSIAPREPPPTDLPDRGDTATRIIATGRRLFAQRGYRGASIRAITDAAGVNLGAVTYHFGSKRSLYEAVVDECLKPLRDTITDVAIRPDPPLARIEAALRAFFQHLRTNPDAPHFLLQEVAAGGTPSEPVRQTIDQVLGTLAGLVEEGQQDGSVVPTADPHLTAVSIVAQPVHLTLLGQLLSRRTDRPVRPLDPDRTEAHAVEFVRAALNPHPETPEQ